MMMKMKVSSDSRYGLDMRLIIASHRTHIWVSSQLVNEIHTMEWDEWWTMEIRTIKMYLEILKNESNIIFMVNFKPSNFRMNVNQGQEVLGHLI